MVKFYSVIAFTALLVAIISLLFAIKGKYSYYWLGSIGIYIFSFLAGFSIGQLTVGLTFIPLTFAIAHSFNWINNMTHSIIFFCISVLIGLLMVLYVGNLLFYPLFWVFSLS